MDMNATSFARESRRGFLGQSLCCAGLAASLLGGLGVPRGLLAASAGAPTPLSADQALERLKHGNAEILADSRRVPKAVGELRRHEIARHQAPFAVILGCADSRVPPELLFNAGLGELFVVRNAGNTLDTVAIGSIEYGVKVLGAPLVVVLGHERCGAVDAALAVLEHNATFPGRIGSMVEPLLPAAIRARSQASDAPPARAASGANAHGHAPAGAAEALLDAAVHENVRRTTLRLRETDSAFLADVRSGRVRIVGGAYDLDDGKVDFFLE